MSFGGGLWGGGGPGPYLSWTIVTAYGADPTGVADSTAAINAAIAAIIAAGSGVLYFPAGTYRTTAPLTTLSVPCTVRGDGGANGSISAADAVTTITSESRTAVVFTISSRNVTVRDLALVNTAILVPTAGAAIRTVNAPGSGNHALFDSVTISGFWAGMDIQYGAEWVMLHCVIRNPVGDALRIQNIAFTDGGDQIVDGCLFTAGPRTVQGAGAAGINWMSGGGTRIVNCKWNGGAAGCFGDAILLNVLDGVQTGPIFVANSSIENYSNHGIVLVNGAAPSTLANINISNCEFLIYPGTNPASSGIIFVPTPNSVSYVIISGCTFQGPSTALAVNLGNTAHGSVIGCRQGGFAAIGGAGPGSADIVVTASS